ncbi:MAG TPA: TIGR03936 family radical SAM-associated protein, partial [Clostridia bacterium]|nr:TIGR03936 family radical SAM-associated protein [Clostridia bacterium]
VILFYAREGSAAWLAHLDMMRLFERAFHRAQWPLSWSDDAYNPRPGIVFALPVGCGIETCRDPMEITLSPDNASFMTELGVERLNASLPPGVRIVAFEEGEPSAKSLMARVVAARYRLDAPGIGQAIIKTFAGGEPVIVDRLRKNKKITVDLAARIFSFDDVQEDWAVLTGGAGSSGHLRVDLVLDALVRDGDLDPEVALGARVTRLRVFLDERPPGQGIIV